MGERSGDAKECRAEQALSQIVNGEDAIKRSKRRENMLNEQVNREAFLGEIRLSGCFEKKRECENARIREGEREASNDAVEKLRILRATLEQPERRCRTNEIGISAALFLVSFVFTH